MRGDEEVTACSEAQDANAIYSIGGSDSGPRILRECAVASCRGYPKNLLGSPRVPRGLQSEQLPCACAHACPFPSNPQVTPVTRCSLQLLTV
jgi:hypothetical protein